MSESRQPTDIQITNTPIDIPPTNTFYLSDDGLPSLAALAPFITDEIAQTSVADSAHTTVRGNLRNQSGPLSARRAFQNEHLGADDVYHGRDASLLMFNVGHSTPLYHSGLIDESNIFRVVDEKGHKEEVFTVVPVGQLLEMAIWMVDKGIPLPQVPSVQFSAATTWFGLIAESLTGELGQGSLQNQVQMIQRRMRKDILERKLQDKRRTPHSVLQEAVRAYYAKRARNSRLVPAARDFMIQLQAYRDMMPAVVDYSADQEIIDGLERRIRDMKHDLDTHPKPFPDEAPPSPTA